MTTELLNNLSDHDLLITLVSEVKGLREEFKRSNDDNAKTTDDHENRIRTIEQKMWYWSGGAGVIGAALSYAVNYLMK